MNTALRAVWLLGEPQTVRAGVTVIQGWVREKLWAQPSRAGQALCGAVLVQAPGLQPSQFPPVTRQGEQATVASLSSLPIHTPFPASSWLQAGDAPSTLGPGMAL